MSKKFLERLGEAFDDGELDDLIPTRKKSSTRTSTAKRSKPSHRKKHFIKNIEEALEGETPLSKSSSTERTFLEAMEGALEDQAFDHVFPRKSVRETKSSKPEDESYVQFQTLISLKVFNRAKEIAIQKGIRIKDVINIALKWYIEQEQLA